MSKRKSNEDFNAVEPKKKIVDSAKNPEVHKSMPIDIVPGSSKSVEIADAKRNECDVAHKCINGETDGDKNDFSTNRYHFDFWNKGSERKCQSKDEDKLYHKINDVAIGKNDSQVLRIRITFKSELKDTRIGKVVSFLAMDDSNEIAIVSFGKIALNLFKIWEVNSVYSIRNFTCHEENLSYPSGSGHKLQIKVNNDFIFEELNDDNTVPPIKFNFKSIEEILCSKLSIRVDLIGILIKDYGVELNSNSVPMRDLSVTDVHKEMIVITLWGAAAENFVGKEKSSIVIRKGAVGVYNEMKKINCTSGTLIWMNPIIEEALSITKWFEENNN